MTDRFNALTVVLSHDIREDDAQRLIEAIGLFPGVIKVIGNVSDPLQLVSDARARRELGCPHCGHDHDAGPTLADLRSLATPPRAGSETTASASVQEPLSANKVIDSFVTALREIEWSNDTAWQSQRARDVLFDNHYMPAKERPASAQGVMGAEVVKLPHPGGVEISALLDSILAEYNWPSNPKNAARAGWTAAMRYLATPAAPSQGAGTGEKR